MAQTRPHTLSGAILGGSWALACGFSPGPALVEQRSPLSDEAQASELLGFSLQQVWPAGPHVATLTWNQSQFGIDFSPSAATTQLRWWLELPERGSELFRIEQVDVECDRTRFVTNTTACDDRLEAALLLHLESDDGALSEEFPVDFDALSPSDLSWNNADLDVAGFSGSFSISASAGEPQTLRLGLFAGFADGELEGALVGDVVLERERKGSATFTSGAVVTIAEWGGSAQGAALQK